MTAKPIIPDDRPNGWYITDEAANHAIVRGPYEHEETVGAVRKELENYWYKDIDKHDSEYAHHPNYWIVYKSTPVETEQDAA